MAEVLMSHREPEGPDHEAEGTEVMMPGYRTRRLTAKEKRLSQFIQVAYQTLRDYQEGVYVQEPGSWTSRGQLDFGLTTVLDNIEAAAERIFK